VALEAKCENTRSCTADEISFKGFLLRWLATTTILAPFTAERIQKVLKSSAQAAVNQCVGGDNGRMCGFAWASGEYDGHANAGEQMNVLAALSSMLITPEKAPITNDTGGTSKGDVNAGSNEAPVIDFKPIVVGDRVGAAILTTLALGVELGVIGWVLWE
jgi:mannan endo-1,6-alpha-mannosidase